MSDRASPPTRRPLAPAVPARAVVTLVALVVLAVLAALAVGGTAAPVAAAPVAAAPVAPAPPATRGPVAAAAPVRAPALVWTDCGGRRQCASVEVPLDYDRPGGPRISLAVGRLPATDPAHRIGSLFVNPGGPGASGLAFLHGLALSGTELWPAELFARFDIVSFDPRGVGSSTRVRCYDSRADETAFESDFPVFPDTADQRARIQRKSSELAARCWARSGALLPHLGTANVARDLDRLRQAVGEERLSYVGYSYGTYLGQVYADLFPGRVRRLVLDGVIDPRAYGSARPGLLGASGPLRMGADVASSDTLRQFFDRCAAAPTCAFAEGGPPRAKFAALIGRLLTAPASVDVGGQLVLVSHQRLIELTAQALYRPAGWDRLGELLQAAYRATEPGVARPDGSDPRTTGALDVDEVGTAIQCADTDVSHRPERWPAVAAAAERRAPYLGAYWAYGLLPCAYWRSPDADRHRGPWTRPTTVPALLLSTVHDPVTPHRGALAVHALRPGSRLLTLDGWGHLTLGQSTCVDRALVAYLVRGVLPPEGAVCAPDRQPFAPPTTPHGPGRPGARRAAEGDGRPLPGPSGARW